MAKKYVIGTLLLAILAASIYVALPGKVKIDVSMASTKYYTYDDGWVLGGIEYVYLYNGTKKMTPLNRVINYTINGLETTITRRSEFAGSSMTHTYTFRGDTSNIELIPVKGKLECFNCSGKIIQFEFNKINYDGFNRNAISPETFGKFKIEWQSGAYFAKVYNYLTSPDKLIVKYKATKDYESYDVRMFDPDPVINTTYLGNVSGVIFYPNLTTAEITFEPYFCYQETANVSNNCTRGFTTFVTNSTGTYNSTIVNGTITDESNWYDGNWSSYTTISYATSPNITYAHFYVNYTKPTWALWNQSYWVLRKYPPNIPPEYINETIINNIPQGCWNQPKIMFDMTMYGWVYGMITIDLMNYSCYDGAKWYVLNTTGSHTWFEEGIYWATKALIPVITSYNNPIVNQTSTGAINVTSMNVSGNYSAVSVYISVNETFDTNPFRCGENLSMQTINTTEWNIFNLSNDTESKYINCYGDYINATESTSHNVTIRGEGIA